MEAILTYKTIDGELFNDKENALIHENMYYAEKCSSLKKENELLKSTTKKFSIQEYKETLINLVPEISGIYMIVNPEDGYKKYIGKADNLKKRYRQFLSDGRYAGEKLEYARKTLEPWKWNYNVLEICPVDRLDEKESFYCNIFKTVATGYNTQRPAGNTKIFNSLNKHQYNNRTKTAYKNYMKRIQSPYREHYRYYENAKFNINQGEFMTNFQNYLNVWGENVSIHINDILFRLNAPDDKVYTIDDIAYIPKELYDIIQRRPKIQKKDKSTYTGTVFKTVLNKWVIADNSDILNYLDRKNMFDTSEDAYNAFLECKLKQILNKTLHLQDMLDEKVVNAIMNLDTKQVEKLICY